MKKAVKVKKVCFHSDGFGLCMKEGSNYRNIGCVGTACKDWLDRDGETPDDRRPGEGEKTTAVTPARQASQACAYAREGTELTDVTKEEIVSGYLNAVSGVLAVVRFGAMMLVKETCLKLQNGAKADDPGYDGGLKGWLADNVPDVNYKTAMGFKGTAWKVCEVLGVSAGVLMRALNPDPKALPDEPDCDALVSARDRLLDIVAGKNSVNALVLWLKGRTPDLLAEGKELEETGKADEIALDAARKFARSVCDALEGMDARKKTALRKALAKDLRERFGAKRLVFLAQVIEEACGE